MDTGYDNEAIQLYAQDILQGRGAILACKNPEERAAAVDYLRQHNQEKGDSFIKDMLLSALSSLESFSPTKPRFIADPSDDRDFKVLCQQHLGIGRVLKGAELTEEERQGYTEIIKLAANRVIDNPPQWRKTLLNNMQGFARGWSAVGESQGNKFTIDILLEALTIKNAKLNNADTQLNILPDNS